MQLSSHVRRNDATQDSMNGQEKRKGDNYEVMMPSPTKLNQQIFVCCSVYILKGLSTSTDTRFDKNHSMDETR